MTPPYTSSRQTGRRPLWSAVNGAKLCFVSPDELVETLAPKLSEQGLQVRRFSGRTELSRQTDLDDDFVIIDGQLDDLESVTTAIGHLDGEPICFLWCDSYTPDVFASAIELGLHAPVTKNSDPTVLLRSLEQEARARDRHGDKHAADPKWIEWLVGKSNSMDRICRRIMDAALSSAPVLISGESGVGKELTTKAIHRFSPRRNQPFVAVNCGAIPEDLVEAELFGHEEGAFTDATHTRLGRFEQADTGTIFLDEIGELAPDMQVKLLRVLEQQRFERVGGEDEIEVDVRVVSATNRDLLKAVHRGDFRRALYHRLNVLEITVPALRDHPEDIRVLWNYFVRQVARAECRMAPETKPEVCQVLQRYRWPGNVRELKNVVHHAISTLSGSQITRQQLPDRLHSNVDRQRREGLPRLQVPGMTLEQLEREAIIATYQWAENAQEAADILGVSRRKVYYKLDEYRDQGHLDESEQPERASVSPDESETKPMLLVAEDDRELRWTIKETLKPNYRVETVSNGRELVAKVRTAEPDMILSDIRMPGLDGIQVLRERHSSGWDIPLVLITAYGDEETRSQANMLGATAFLDKPIEPDELLEALNEAYRKTA